jgi:N-methylhydantoinase A
MSSKFSLAVDIGGTFTDFVLLDHQQRVVLTDKVLTTPHSPERAILQGVEKLSQRIALDLRSADLFLHATTIITNAVIERKGSDFILLHTAGFRDLLEIGREHRYNLTDLKLRFPDPVGRRDLRLAVDERVSAAGEVARAPDKAALMAQLIALAERHDVRSFAVCFLHSYRNAANEEIVRDWIREAFPNAYVSCSAAVAPTQREYERWTTCTINAYTMPLLADYVGRLRLALAEGGFAGRALMMTSSGLPLEFDRCVGYPIRMIESGPAAGVLAAQEIAARIDLPQPVAGDAAVRLSNVLAFDMGGTTAKGAFLTHGAFHVQRSLEVARVGTFQPGSGLPLMIPAIDLIEIGAGGGSIATIDDRGAIAVGPSSAGADPGPACYDRGGTAATLTDANVALGYLSEENFANSGIVVQRSRAQAVIQSLADRLGTSLERVARGIRETVNENVARAFRVHAGELGIDYRRYALVCTGGSAPLHAAEIARTLSIKTVAFPFGAGVSSAFGLFVGREGLTLQKTNALRLDTLPAGRVSAEVRALIEGDANARALAAAGADVVLTLGMRYVGQGYEIDVGIDDIATCDSAAIREAFHRAYRAVFGVIFPDYVIEIFNWTVQIMVRDKLCDLSRFRYANAGTTTRKIKAPRRILDTGTGEAAELAVYDRYALRPGDTIEGGALIEENDTTIYLPRFARGTVTESFDILADIQSRR